MFSGCGYVKIHDPNSSVPQSLLEMNFFLGIFQGFCLKFQRTSFTEHRIVHFNKSE